MPSAARVRATLPTTLMTSVAVSASVALRPTYLTTTLSPATPTSSVAVPRGRSWSASARAGVLVGRRGSSVSGPVSAPSVTGSAVAAVVPLTAKPTPLAFFAVSDDFGASVPSASPRRSRTRLAGTASRRGGGGQGDGLGVHWFSVLSVISAPGLVSVVGLVSIWALRWPRPALVPGALVRPAAAAERPRSPRGARPGASPERPGVSPRAAGPRRRSGRARADVSRERPSCCSPPRCCRGARPGPPAGRGSSRRSSRSSRGCTGRRPVVRRARPAGAGSRSRRWRRAVVVGLVGKVDADRVERRADGSGISTPRGHRRGVPPNAASVTAADARRTTAKRAARAAGAAGSPRPSAGPRAAAALIAARCRRAVVLAGGEGTAGARPRRPGDARRDVGLRRRRVIALRLWPRRCCLRASTTPFTHAANGDFASLLSFLRSTGRRSWPGARSSLHAASPSGLGSASTRLTPTTHAANGLLPLPRSSSSWLRLAELRGGWSGALPPRSLPCPRRRRGRGRASGGRRGRSGLGRDARHEGLSLERRKGVRPLHAPQPAPLQGLDRAGPLADARAISSMVRSPRIRSSRTRALVGRQLVDARAARARASSAAVASSATSPPAPARRRASSGAAAPPAGASAGGASSTSRRWAIVKTQRAEVALAAAEAAQVADDLEEHLARQVLGLGRAAARAGSRRPAGASAA